MADPREVTLDLVVAGRRVEADGVIGLDLRHPAGDPLPKWTPGAHVDLVLPDGLVRQYSLCGDPADTATWRIAVLLEDGGRGGSQAVHGRLHPGTPVQVRGPRNQFTLEPAAQYVFVAGGIGITPILAMVRQATRLGARWRLAYGGRTTASMALVDELHALAAAAGDRAELTLHPLQTHGLLPVADLVEQAARTGADVYCCGPEPLLDAVVTEGDRLGPGRVHVERFRPASDAVPAVAEGDTGFELEVRPSGAVLVVPAGRTALEVLEEAGLAPLSSCREGTCGTCEVEVVSGPVDHRDSLLTADERAAGDTMFPCVSRALGSRVVIEL